MSDDEFAADELAMLRDFFRDEAQEALDRLTTRLLGAGQEPGRELITELLRTTHTLKGSAGTVGLSDMVHVTHELEEQFARLRDGRIPWSEAFLEQLVDAVDAVRACVDAIGTPSLYAELAGRALQKLDAAGAPEPQSPVPRYADDGDPDQTRPLHAPWLHNLGRKADISGQVREQPAAEPLPDSLPSAREGAVPVQATRSIVTAADTWRRDSRSVLRVESSRVDQLMDCMSELVLDRTRIERSAQVLRGLLRDLDPVAQSLTRQGHSILGAELDERLSQMHRAIAELLDDAEALRRTSIRLQLGLTRVRMSSARHLFQALSRQLRSIARSAGKKIRLVTSGDDTEFDKTVAERITDPLIQILRNAVAHGIEPEAERVAAGKRAEGLVRLDARQQGSSVIIEVTDDGAGIDPDVLRARFVAAGRWSRARAELASDEDVLHALFDPGVSTRDAADQLAGRGVGLDAVRETIARLGGEIRMTSTPGKGTGFIMRLPVSMAVSHALLFEVAGNVYAVPNVHVVDIIAPGSAPAGRDSLELPGGPVPLLDLHEVLGVDAPGGASGSYIALEYTGRRLAIPCDVVVGVREIVVKELGPLLAPLPLYAGATISSEGKVQLILDPAALARLVYPEPDPAADEPGTAAPARALVADDSPAMRAAMAHIVESAGYAADSAEDGARAWALLAQRPYDLLITDIDMPHLDGFGLIERLRRDTRLARVRVIVVSASDTPEHRERARALGVAAFVAKPITPGKLHAVL